MRARVAFVLVLSALLAAAGAWAGQGAGRHGSGSTVAEDPGLQRLRGLHQGKGLQGLRSLHTGKGLESIRGLHLGKGIEGLPGRGGASGKGADRRHHFTGDDLRAFAGTSGITGPAAGFTGDTPTSRGTGGCCTCAGSWWSLRSTGPKVQTSTWRA